MESKTILKQMKNTVIKPYLSYIDDGNLFRKPFSWLYALFAILNLLFPVYIFFDHIDDILAYGGPKIIFAFLLSMTVLVFGAWISFEIWWNRKSKLNTFANTDDEFIATPVFSNFVQTFGEWFGSYIAVVGTGISFILTIMGESIYYLRILPIDTGIVSIIGMPIFGFLVIVFFRFASEQIRVLAAIANNTKK